MLRRGCIIMLMLVVGMPGAGAMAGIHVSTTLTGVETLECTGMDIPLIGCFNPCSLVCKPPSVPKESD